jgi:EmrB/QacA subfamily drug resistance transporter
MLRDVVFRVGPCRPGEAAGHIAELSSKESELHVRTRQMNQKIAVAVVYVAAMFMAILDSTIVNVALPTLSRDFHVSTDGIDAISIAYLVSLGVFIPISGWLGDRLGGRRTLLGAIALFVTASALCGFSSSFGELVGFRILQGVGGGLMTPVGLAMLFRVFPPAERVRASSILVLPTAAAPALGPVLGGLFTTELSWRWVFYVNLPIGILALVFGLLFLGDHVHGASSRVDLGGFLLSGAALGLAMYGVSEGPLDGWSTPAVLASVSAGAVLLVAFVVYERRRANPLIDLSLFANRLFTSTTSVIVVATISFLGTLYLASLLFQNALGMSALRAGLTIFPEALGVMAGSQVVTRFLYPRLGPRRILIAGLLAIGVAMILLTRVSPGTNEWLIRLDMTFLGYGFSHVFLPAQAASFATISPQRTSAASAVFNALRQLGGAVGVALVTTVIAEGPSHHVVSISEPTLAAYRHGFVAAAATALVAAGVAVSVRDADAAETMVRRRATERGGNLEPGVDAARVTAT